VPAAVWLSRGVAVLLAAWPWTEISGSVGPRQLDPEVTRQFVYFF
jgi:hypothetical protein